MEIINYDNNIEELKMEDIIQHGEVNTERLGIDWILLNGCNYQCSYCFGQEKFKKDFIEIDKLKHAVNEIFKIHKKYYSFTLVGGEVTYHPHFLELVEYIYSFNKNVSILLITNGSKDTNYFNKIFSFVRDNIFSCIISVHFEYANLEHIKDLIKLFNEHKKNLHLNLMLHPEYKDKISSFLDDLLIMRKDYIFNLSLNELREGPDFTRVDSRYDDDFFKWIDLSREKIYNSLFKPNIFQETFNIYSKGYYLTNDYKKLTLNHDLAVRYNLKDFRKFYCCGGINLIRIESNGEYKAGICGVFPIVGNIYEENIDICKIGNYRICTEEQCGCVVNDRNFKTRDINIAENYIFNYRRDNSYLVFSKENISIQDDKLNRLIDSIAWWIPVKKWRDNFRNNILCKK
ncbi:radical SAM protein [Brachyspira intermedia]|uniref:radical SAM protein n=1 Tax=Brachyspira intermedia TaxID=84377 RepID=UPI0030077454